MPDPNRKTQLILASASPRRKQLLEQIGVQCEALAVDIDETPHDGESPAQLVVRLSNSKAVACLANLAPVLHPIVCLGADTVIDLDGQILGKPENQTHAVEMLLQLAEREHTVRTGVSLCSSQQDQPGSFMVSTSVRFGTISETQAAHYWATGEPADKAGGYAIQGRGAQFVAHLSGSYSNVVGLPLYETTQLLHSVAPDLFHES